MKAAVALTIWSVGVFLATSSVVGAWLAVVWTVFWMIVDA